MLIYSGIPFYYLLPPQLHIHSLSLRDALPIFSLSFLSTPESMCLAYRTACSWYWSLTRAKNVTQRCFKRPSPNSSRSEEHTSELQSYVNLVCRLLLEKKIEVLPLSFVHST